MVTAYNTYIRVCAEASVNVQGGCLICIRWHVYCVQSKCKCVAVNAVQVDILQLLPFTKLLFFASNMYRVTMEIYAESLKHQVTA